MKYVLDNHDGTYEYGVMSVDVKGKTTLAKHGVAQSLDEASIAVWGQPWSARTRETPVPFAKLRQKLKERLQ